MMEKIEDPRDFILHHLKENHIISKVESTTELSEHDWLKLVSPDDPDIHDIKKTLQLQYQFGPHSGKAPHYLMVDENGTVSVKGTATDKRTFFDVTVNTITGTYNIRTCRSMKDSLKDPQRIIYMDGTALRSKICDANGYEAGVDTIFDFKSRSSTEQKPPFEIVSQSGVPLRFDRKGNYVSARKKCNNSDPPCNFYIHMVDTMYVSSV